MTSSARPAAPAASLPRTIARVLLGLVLLGAGISHLTVARQEFTAQVPEWLGGPWTVGRVAGVVMYGVSVFGGLLALGRVGERLYQYVVVQSLGWLTEDEADEARRNEKQYF